MAIEAPVPELNVPSGSHDYSWLGETLWAISIDEERLVVWELVAGGLIQRADGPLWPDWIGLGAGEGISVAAHGKQLLCIVADEREARWTSFCPGEPPDFKWHEAPWGARGAFASVSLEGSAHLFSAFPAELPQSITIAHYTFDEQTWSWRRQGRLQTTLPTQELSPQTCHVQGLRVSLTGARLTLDVSACIGNTSVLYRARRDPSGWPHGGWEPGDWQVGSGAPTVSPQRTRPRKKSPTVPLDPEVLLEQITRLFDRYTFLRARLDELRLEESKLRSRNETLQEELASVRRRARNAQSNNSRLRSTLRAAVSDREEYATRLGEAERRLLELQRERERVEMDLTARLREKVRAEEAELASRRRSSTTRVLAPESAEQDATPWAALLDRFVRWVRE